MNLFYQLRAAFTFLLMLNVAVFAQEFSAPVNVSDRTNSDVLRVGVHPDGTDFFDAGLDTLAPPAAPPGAFDARLQGISDDYIADIRDNSITEKTYVVKYAASNGNGPIVLNWDSGSLQALGDFVITDNIDGLQFSLDMTTTDSLDVSSNTSISGSLRILVTPQVAPVLTPISDLTLGEGLSLNIVISATDANGDDIILAANNLPPFGSLTDNGDGTGTLSFAPDFDDAGFYAGIEITATDDRSVPLSDTVSFDLTVNNVNRAPVVNPINNQSMDEGTILILPIFASDPDGNTILLGASNLPSFGNLTDNGNGTGTLRFTPGFADGGLYSNIIVSVTDDGGLSGDTSFNLTVIDTNRAPIAAPDSASTEEDTPFSISVLINDSDPNSESLTISSVTQPANGTVIIEPGKTTVTYTPDLNFNGDDTFTYTANDGSGGEDSATVVVTVTPVNDPPTISLPDTLTLPADLSFTLNIWDGVSDPETGNSDLTYDFSASPDILNLDYDAATGILSITVQDTVENNSSDLTVTVLDPDGGLSATTIQVIIDIPLSIGGRFDRPTLPNKPVLRQNYPNPFNPTTRIPYSLPVATHVKIEVYNSLGQRIAILTSANKPAGEHAVHFEANAYVSGTYYYQIQAEGFRQVRKMLLIK